MRFLDMLLRFLYLTGAIIVLGALGIGLCVVVMFATYYTLITL